MASSREPLIVDRAKPLVYPNWHDESAQLEPSSVGPSSYDPARIRIEQCTGHNRKADDFYRKMLEKGILQECLGYADALTIHEKGLKYFIDRFGRKVKVLVFLGGAVSDYQGKIWIPTISGPLFSTSRKELILDWSTILMGVDKYFGIPMFPKPDS